MKFITIAYYPEEVKRVVVRKGSSASGNFGHAGRPGKVGGSAPGALQHFEDNHHWISDVTFGKINLDGDITPYEPSDEFVGYLQDHMNEFMNSDPDNKEQVDILDFIRSSYEGTMERTGYTSKVTRIMWHEREGIKVYGEIRNERGRKAGDFSRLIHNFSGFDENGKEIAGTEVYHDFFDMNEGEQGGGVGSWFYEHSEDVYKEAGIKRIRLFADLNVGGYAWARMGFDWESNYEISGMVFKLETLWHANYGTPLPGIIKWRASKHPWNLAIIKGPDGEHMGKAAMLGGNWHGVKWLIPGSQSYLVGQQYYKAKKARK